ncbi:hypothetical protein [Holophaga foetida]|uniref:hypothetical protein n=1 Tax=Holophaga foetida TaxID=35839 RepID=UPI0002473AE0|nr:hypothetical protein [Holophaga foetida]
MSSLLPGLDQRALLYLGALALCLWLLNQARRWLWFFSLLALPGTFCHELCHWLTGKLLNGQPIGFTVIPRREGKGLVLGSVRCAHLRWYNAFFIGAAPLVLLPLAFLLLRWRLALRPAMGWGEALGIYLLANLVFGAIPSGQDLRVATRSPIGWLLLGAAGVCVWMRCTGRI